MRILLADNSTDLLQALTKALRDRGYWVTATDNGADALCLLSGPKPPDLILLDLNMPGLDGYDVISRLGPTSPPVVVITGTLVDPRSLDTSKVKRVLTKPFDLTDLMNAVEDALGIKPQASPPTSTPVELGDGNRGPE